MNAEARSRLLAARQIDAQIATVIRDTVGAEVEVTTASSRFRGFFVSVAGTAAAVTAARSFLELAGNAFTDRDDCDDPELGDFVVDFYRPIAK